MARTIRTTLCGMLALCGGVTSTTPAPAAEVKYMLWDSVQAPAYRQCAAGFMRGHPGTTIKMIQYGWHDYWTTVAMGFIAGTAPDVFVNHLSKSPQFSGNGLLADLAPYVKRDSVDLAAFAPGLADAWRSGSAQVGLPKDLDTVALLVNLEHARKAGVSLEQLRTMRWNPRDGGNFEQVMRKLTLDSNGHAATSPAFDRRRVAVYGYQNPGAGGMTGQTEWSHFAASNGFTFQQPPGQGAFHYDDQRLADTVDWLAGLPAKGLSASYQNTRSMGADAMFVAGKAAMVPAGSWMIMYFAAHAKFDTAWVPLPVGPGGYRASMMNGVADSIWSGSKVKEEAWQWVKYMASPACQDVVADYGVTFPALAGKAARAVESIRRKTGIDASAFLDMAREHTFLPPVTDNAPQVDELVKRAIESALLGKQAALPALQEANDKVNRLKPHH